MRDQVTAIVSPTTTNGLMSPCQRSRWWNPHAWRSSFYSFTHSWTYLCSSFLLIRLIALAQLAFQPCADALLLLTDEERQLNGKYPLPGKAEAANSLQTDSFPCWKDKCHRRTQNHARFSLLQRMCETSSARPQFITTFPSTGTASLSGYTLAMREPRTWATQSSPSSCRYTPRHQNLSSGSRIHVSQYLSVLFCLDWDQLTRIFFLRLCKSARFRWK